MHGQRREQIKPGLKVAIVMKPDQRSGRLTEGVVSGLLTKSAFHPHGIKVRLNGGTGWPGSKDSGVVVSNSFCAIHCY